MNEAALTAEEFFGSSWSGSGVVSDLMGRKLRSFALDYVGAWSERESGFLCEETVSYDAGFALRRSWHVATDGEGVLLGLEGCQGGRMRILNDAQGFSFVFDRLPHAPGPNVRKLRSRLWRGDDGVVHAIGRTLVVGLIPMMRTTAVLFPKGNERA